MSLAGLVVGVFILAPVNLFTCSDLFANRCDNRTGTCYLFSISIWKQVDRSAIGSKCHTEYIFGMPFIAVWTMTCPSCSILSRTARTLGLVHLESIDDSSLTI